MLKSQALRFVSSRPRPRSSLLVALFFVAVYLLTLQGSSIGYHVVPWRHGSTSKSREPGTEESERQMPQEERDRHDQELRDLFQAEYETTSKYVLQPFYKGA
jgi:hypothetical protein